MQPRQAFLDSIAKQDTDALKVTSERQLDALLDAICGHPWLSHDDRENLGELALRYSTAHAAYISAKTLERMDEMRAQLVKAADAIAEVKTDADKILLVDMLSAMLEPVRKAAVRA